MSRARRPFVIALVTAVVSVLVLAAIPGFGLFGHRCPRRCANETAAIATLRNIHAAQWQFRHAGPDHYGTFRELSAGSPVRGTGRLIDPPMLSRAFQQVRPDGTVLRSGYRFRIDLTGETWCAWAWPHRRDQGVRRTFFVNGATDSIILATVDDRHEGDTGPEDVLPAAHTTGSDGSAWRLVP